MKKQIISLVTSLIIGLNGWQASAKDVAPLPKSWDTNTRAVYDLIVAQLQNAGADYVGSVDTLVKFARQQKDDALYAKAYKALLQTRRYADAVKLSKDWQSHSKARVNPFYVLALALNAETDLALSEMDKALQDVLTDDMVNDTEIIERVLYPYLSALLSNWYQPNMIKVFARLYESYPDSEILALSYAKQLRWLGDVDRAVAIIEKRRFNDPRNLMLAQQKSDTYRYAMRLEEAEKVWQGLLADYPREETFQFAYARFLYDRYDFAGAEKQLDNISDVDIRVAVNTLKMMAQVQLGNYSAAEATFANNFDSVDDKLRARYNLADSLLAQQQYKLAKKHFEQLIAFDNAVDSDLALPAALKIGQILYTPEAQDTQDTQDTQDQDTQDDTQDTHKALQRGDKWFAKVADYFRLSNAESLQERVNALQQAGREQLAYQQLNDFLAVNPNNETIRYTRGLVAAEMGLEKQAIEDLKVLHATSPEHIDVQNALGYTLLGDDKTLDEGERLVRKALFSKPESPAINDSMGWVYYRRGEFNKAMPYLRFSYGNYLDGEIIGHYILALHHNGKPDLAKKMYQLESRYAPNVKKINRHVKSILPQLQHTTNDGDK